MGDYRDYNDDNNDLMQVDETYDAQPVTMSDRKILSYCGLYLSLMTVAVFAVQFLLSAIFRIFIPDAIEASWFNVILTLVGIVGLACRYLLSL